MDSREREIVSLMGCVFRGFPIRSPRPSRVNQRPRPNIGAIINSIDVSQHFQPLYIFNVYWFRLANCLRGNGAAEIFGIFVYRTGCYY